MPEGEFDMDVTLKIPCGYKFIIVPDYPCIVEWFGEQEDDVGYRVIVDGEGAEGEKCGVDVTVWCVDDQQERCEEKYKYYTGV